MRLKYCISHVAYILCSAHSKGARRQCNALNKIYLFTYTFTGWETTTAIPIITAAPHYFKTTSLHILECCFARSLQASFRLARCTAVMNSYPWIFTTKVCTTCWLCHVVHTIVERERTRRKWRICLAANFQRRSGSSTFMQGLYDRSLTISF
jgi:hypothetical protein